MPGILQKSLQTRQWDKLTEIGSANGAMSWKVNTATTPGWPLSSSHRWRWAWRGRGGCAGLRHEASRQAGIVDEGGLSGEQAEILSSPNHTDVGHLQLLLPVWLAKWPAR